MSSGEYYFERHLSQFYRISFFFLELQSRGIWTDEDDIYPGPIPFEVVPEEIQAILYNDIAYHDYLSANSPTESSARENCSTLNFTRPAFISEENLFISFLTRIKNSFGTTTTSTTTSPRIMTTTRVFSTTKHSRKRSKKGSVCVNVHGKHFSKRQKTFIDNCCENGNRKYDSSGLKKAMNSENHKQQQMISSDQNFGVRENFSDHLQGNVFQKGNLKILLRKIVIKILVVQY